MSNIMMSKKTKRLYGRMQHGIQQKKEGVQSLVEKRKRIEEEKGDEKVSKVSKKSKKGKSTKINLST